MRADEEYAQNAGVRRGLVVDRDPKTMRVKVLFQDEDDVVTQWIDVVSKSATGVSVYQMPGKDDEVWVAVDAKGEGGCLIGSRFNAKDAPPSDNNDHITMTGPFGTVHTDGSNMVIDCSGNVTIKAAGDVTVESAGDATIKAANIKLESATLTHNGKNIGFDHGHESAQPGKPGPPV